MFDNDKLRPAPEYIDVRFDGRLLFKYDPRRDVVEIRSRGETVYVDLARLRANEPFVRKRSAPAG